MSLGRIEDSRRAARRARQRFEATLAATQQRLRPQNLAGEAWDGVKGKSADLAEGALGAVRKRPAAVLLALGALGLFLARAPLKRAVSRLINGEDEEEDAAGIEPAEPELSDGGKAPEIL